MRGFLKRCLPPHCGIFCAMDVLCRGYFVPRIFCATVLACGRPPVGRGGHMGWGAWAAPDGGVKPRPSITAPRDAAEERGREMGIARGEVFLLPPSNKRGKSASPTAPCPSWSLDLPAEGITATSKASGPSWLSHPLCSPAPGDASLHVRLPPTRTLGVCHVYF